MGLTSSTFIIRGVPVITRSSPESMRVDTGAFDSEVGTCCRPGSRADIQRRLNLVDSTYGKNATARVTTCFAEDGTRRGGERKKQILIAFILVLLHEQRSLITLF